MKSKATNPMVLKPSLPNGTFPGKWSGFEVLFLAEGVQYKADTEQGVRGYSEDCWVTIDAGEITVETAKI